MLLNKHGSFYIRNGWITKIINSLSENAYLFSPNKELQAVDIAGVGRVMVKAMRYWATAVGIVEEGKDQQGIVCQLTELGQIIRDYDLYCLDKATLWLLHRNLACQDDFATAWYWAFNIYSSKSFTKDEFCASFYSYIQREGGVYQKSMIEKEFDCFKNTYVNDKGFDLAKIIEENTIPFFAPLNLLNKSAGDIFEKAKVKAKDIPIDILIYCILKDNEEALINNRQLSIDHLLEDSKQVGRYMNISYAVLLELLQQLENEKYLRVTNNFGNRHIQLEVNEAPKEILERHYRDNVR